MGVLTDLLVARLGVTFVVEENPVTDTVTTTPTLILRHDSNRVAYTIVNLGSVPCFVGFTPDVSPQRGLILPSNGGQITVLWEEDLVIPQLEVYAVTTTGTTKIYVLQIIATR